MNKLMHFIKNNGERPPLDYKFEQVPSDLQVAYKFVSTKVKNKTILDYGCGGGYGAEYLSRFTNKNVTGFDIDKYTIKSASNYFSSINSLKFISKYKKISYDVIVSFQVIEHLNKYELRKYLNNIKLSMHKKSTLYISTVNKNITSYNLKIPTMSHHIYEYNPIELKKMLSDHFSKVKMYGQIDNEIKSKVLNNQYSYNQLNLIPLKYRLLRPFTQIQLFRKIAAYTPKIIKDILFFQLNNAIPTYSLTTNSKLIDNSYILLYQCKI